MSGNNGASASPILAPHSREAEEALLGSLLMSDDDWFLVADKLTPEDFFIQRNGFVWAAMQRIKARKNGAIDNLTVVEELSKARDGVADDAPTHLDAIGGAIYITKLITNSLGSIYSEEYAGIIERASVRRRMLGAASEIAKLATKESADLDTDIAEAEKALFNGVARRSKRNDARLKDVLVSHANRMHERASRAKDKQVYGVPSGFSELDTLLGGFEKGYLIYLAGRPGMGKTALMLNIALNAARTGARVGFFSMEMSKPRLVSRLIAMETGISTAKQRAGRLTDQEWALYFEAQDRLSKLPIILDDTPKLSPQAMRNKAIRWHGEHGLDIIFGDYIGLMSVPGMSLDNRNTLVTEISSANMALVRELDIPLIMASQLSRALENRKDKRPVPADLRDSGSLEQDADMILFIYRDEVYNEDTERPNQADIIIAKHRDGPTGSVPLYFRKELTQFSDLKKHSVDFASYGDGYKSTRIEED
jgi:replicative DNA helicase